MRTRHRLAVAAAVLACLAAASGVQASARELQATDACKVQHVDKTFYLVVDARVCNFYRPGNATERGPAAFTSSTMTPVDCITVNETIPGPPLRVRLNDWVRVDVQSNLIGREINFHWHGFSQKGTPWADGAGMITTCNIRPGQGATYVFQAQEAGVYFYHGHGGLEEEYGLAGSFIVDDPHDPFTSGYYDEEAPVDHELRDWWWAPDGHAGQALAFRFFQQIAPHGIPLINGLYGNGSSVLPYPVFNLATNTCYRTRFINGNTEWPGWFVSMTDEAGRPVNMTMLSLTGENLRPFNTHRFTFYIAQRAEAVFCTNGPGIWNVLVNSTQSENGYCTGPSPGCLNGMTYQFNVGGMTSNASKTANRAMLQSLPFVETFDSMVHPEQVVPLVPVVVPSNVTQTWNTYAAIIPGNMYLWTERNWGLAMPTAPPLFTRGGHCGTAAQPAPGQRPTATNNKAYLQKTAGRNEVVDIIFNNLSPFYHPMHLHGYDFIVLASRYYVDAGYDPRPQQLCPNSYMWAQPSYDGTMMVNGSWPTKTPTGGNFNAFAFGCPYNASEDNSRFYLANPYETDIVPVPPHGWVHVRVKFDNPGVWFLHCHLNIHMLSGMGFIVHADLPHAPKIPSWVDTSCGGRCQALDQICGPYAPKRANVPKCSGYQDTCAPTGIINSSIYG